jgi:hypothetical protein
MGKLSYINPSNFEPEEIEFADNQIKLAEYVEAAVHMEGFQVSGPIISDDKKKLVIGVFEKSTSMFEIAPPLRERYKIIIEKI